MAVPTATPLSLTVVGDVSGKGLKAAMLVSVTIGILRTEKSPSPAVILRTMNEGPYRTDARAGLSPAAARGSIRLER